MQIKPTLRFHLTPISMVKIKNSHVGILAYEEEEDVSNWNIPSLLLGFQTYTLTLEITLTFSQKLGIILPEDPLLGIYLKRSYYTAGTPAHLCS